MMSTAVLGASHLHIAASAVCGAAGIAQAQGVVAELAHRGEHRLGFGQREAYPLVRASGAPKAWRSLT